MAPNPLNIALNVAQTPIRLTQKAVGAVLGGGQESSSQPKDLDDVTIAHKVESALFRDRRIAKGKVDIDVADGVVTLRGQARTPQLVKLAERRASSVPEVSDVENLLHLPKTPARRQKPQRSPKKPSRSQVSPPAPTAEKPAAEAEPAPRELAARGEGRHPAPLGQREQAEEQALEDREPAASGRSEQAEEPTREPEPTPGELAASGEARQPSPLGQSEQGNGGAGSSS